MVNVTLRDNAHLSIVTGGISTPPTLPPDPDAEPHRYEFLGFVEKRGEDFDWWAVYPSASPDHNLTLGSVFGTRAFYLLKNPEVPSDVLANIARAQARHAFDPSHERLITAFWESLMDEVQIRLAN